MRRLVRTLVILIIIILLIPAGLVLCLRWVNPPTSAFMLETGARLAHARPGANPAIYHTWVDIDAIAPAMALAVVAGEDQTFPTNHGFAWGQIKKAIKQDLHGGNLRGASTITQQVAKNLFLWPTKSFFRKGIEAYITVWIDLLWSKTRTLEMYLNFAQFGSRCFGVGAAAPRLLGTSAGALSRWQAALLAASLPAPDQASYTHPSAYLRSRQYWILQQMRQLGPSHLAGVIGN